jgi:hypothetical protein
MNAMRAHPASTARQKTYSACVSDALTLALVPATRAPNALVFMQVMCGILMKCVLSTSFRPASGLHALD